LSFNVRLHKGSSIIKKITARGFKIGVVSVAVSFFAYLTLDDPRVWPINLIIWPICLLVIFDRGYSRAIDVAYGAVSHLKGKSDRADQMLVLLSGGKLKLVKTHLLMLKHELPEEKESIDAKGVKS
ncbi:MAG: hypothetical protein JKY89_10290, partial [Immundisolibacteraceae bacterium]|nr:hypothetical protein [Immundisolibacteraceae bacterium]